ncbi:Signal recognition particle receptor subunit beta [Halotydeus destructor]|nr:Signal recognition particle receptor subunit beta [Halotydeus destructor]
MRAADTVFAEQSTVPGITMDTFEKSKLYLGQFVGDDLVKHPNFAPVAIALAVAVLIVTIALLKFLTKKASSGDAILLVGLSDAGKTVMFSQLTAEQYVETVTSMKENDSEAEIGKKRVHIIDLPGFERLQEKYWSTFKGNAKGIIFVIDSLLFLSNIRDVADMLYTVLSDPVVTKRRIPVLIACNKQDEAKAKSSKVIQAQLEKEINNIRETRSAALSSTDGSEDGSLVLGNADRDFEYGDLKMPIHFVDCSCTDNGEQLDSVRRWIAQAA